MDLRYTDRVGPFHESNRRIIRATACKLSLYRAFLYRLCEAESRLCSPKARSDKTTCINHLIRAIESIYAQENQAPTEVDGPGTCHSPDPRYGGEFQGRRSCQSFPFRIHYIGSSLQFASHNNAVSALRNSLWSIIGIPIQCYCIKHILIEPV